MEKQELIDSIDFTYLKVSMDMEENSKICDAIEKYSITNLCVHPEFGRWYNFTKEYIDNPIAVFNFPYGCQDISHLIDDIIKYRQYFCEIDCVYPPPSIYNYKWIEGFSSLRNMFDGKIKFIIEYYLGQHNDLNLKYVLENLIANKIDYVKTCTGHGPRGVELDDIKRIKDIVGDKIKVKASGGISSLRQLIELKNAGANRFGIGLDNAIKIIEEFDEKN